VCACDACVAVTAGDVTFGRPEDLASKMRLAGKFGNGPCFGLCASQNLPEMELFNEFVFLNVILNFDV